MRTSYELLLDDREKAAKRHSRDVCETEKGIYMV